MFWSKLSLAIQIALVVVAVIVFSFFDPFGFLSSRKKKLQDTPVTVTSIREIGQLITAEYFGEVLTSLQEAEVQDLKIDKAVGRLDSLKDEYILAIKYFIDNKASIPQHWLTRGNDLMDYFYEVNTHLVNDVLYQDFIHAVIEISGSQTGVKNEKNLLKLLYKNPEVLSNILPSIQASIAPKNNSVNLYSLLNKALEDKTKELTAEKKFKKRQIIVLGRGWVRAGLDFGTFNESNFKYDKDKNTIYLFNLEAKILDCDINPWFIPEKKVKGFEIIAATNKAKSTDYLIKVKKQCRDELRTQAEESGIIAKAHNYAEQSLKHFFSILLDHPVDRVVIMKKSPLDFSNLIVERKIERSRLKLIDRTLLSLDSIDRSVSDSLVRSLNKSCYFINKDSLIKINRYSALIEKVAYDNILTVPELDSLKAIFHSKFTNLDSIWFLRNDFIATTRTNARKDARSKSYHDKMFYNFYYDSINKSSQYKTYMLDMKDSVDKLFKIQLEKARDSALSTSVSQLKQRIKKVYIKDIKGNFIETVDSLVIINNIDSIAVGGSMK